MDKTKVKSFGEYLSKDIAKVRVIGKGVRLVLKVEVSGREAGYKKVNGEQY